MSIKSATFNKKRFQMFFGEDVDGLCDLSQYSDLEMIIVAPRENSQRYLHTLIHEALHGCGLESDKQVTPIANDISRFLWRMGYRLKK